MAVSADETEADRVWRRVHVLHEAPDDIGYDVTLQSTDGSQVVDEEDVSWLGDTAI